jgi:hypothetical protein
MKNAIEIFGVKPPVDERFSRPSWRLLGRTGPLRRPPLLERRHDRRSTGRR